MMMTKDVLTEGRPAQITDPLHFHHGDETVGREEEILLRYGGPRSWGDYRTRLLPEAHMIEMEWRLNKPVYKAKTRLL